ncbi:MAG: NUDIX domain-containing protein [Halothiobacillaceae bacterium]
MQWELLAREVLYQGFFRLERYHLRHQRYAGGWTDIIRREIFERGHAVAVLPYDPKRDTVVMLEQFRPGALDAPGGPWLREFPAGMIEPGESLEDVVRREMLEEAGLVPTRLEYITRCWVSPGGTTESLYLYWAEVDSEGVGGLHGLPHEHEDIRVSVVPREEALALLEQGLICSAAPMILMQWLALNSDRLRGMVGVR